MIQSAEIKEQINDGDIDELQELNEKICTVKKAWKHGRDCSRRNVG